MPTIADRTISEMTIEIINSTSVKPRTNLRMIGALASRVGR